jgi:hypothetical protein
MKGETDMHIAIRNDRLNKCWLATFAGGHMPQNVPLPLPFNNDATFAQVAADLMRRFPGATVS